MDKEKEIEEMVNALRYVLCGDTDYCDDCSYRGYGDCENRKIANRIYEAGYRKADEVRKETIREISKWLHEHYRAEFLGLFDKTFGIEVEE